jgi:tRNA(fMet)-specific endonuclease VapC
VVYFLDTNAVTDLMRNNRQIRTRVSQLSANDRTCIGPVVRGEILHGIARQSPGKRRTELEQQAQDVFATISCEAMLPEVADAYARIKLAQQQLGLSLDENDLWIAAHATALAATVVTRDQDFSQVPGLLMEDWTK